ncbi:hypothetical protein VD0004_g7889 [Verticillium dahliae]|uniref:Uncharacterized protein n=1 Tax=Verticillium dahliae TaxID=27337 RepID=A0A444RUD7_VERDA|nr:hypothetical protein VD0004_g7889 [Verticillium dahliae]PNH67453.1 hypothetical protein VD0001_g7812 [Verticillium dahliae]RXG44745.1 hypothetical protein VDGE_02522 [Verticillium dahliae]
MEGNLPSPDYAYDMEWKWPWAKFELPPNALFTTLQERFNTRQCPIQDPYAFHQDVCESADYSATLEEFYTQLSARRDERVRELNEAWADIASLLAWSSNWNCAGCEQQTPGESSENDDVTSRWSKFCDLSRTMSFDSMVRFFDGWCRDRRRIETQQYLDLKRDVQAFRDRKPIKFPINRVTSDAVNSEAATTRDGRLSSTPEAFRPVSPESIVYNINNEGRKEGEVVEKQKESSQTTTAKVSREHFKSEIGPLGPQEESRHDKYVSKAHRTTADVDYPAPRNSKRAITTREELQEGDSTDGQALHSKKRRRISQEHHDGCIMGRSGVENHRMSKKTSGEVPDQQAESRDVWDRSLSPETGH